MGSAHFTLFHQGGRLKGHAKNYYPYHPEVFDYSAVNFDNPDKRFKEAFGK